MAQTTLSVRMDVEMKKSFESFCEDVGMNVSTAINMFVKAVLREHKLPFEVVSYNTDPFYSQANYQRLLAAAERMDLGKGREHAMNEVADA
ncbi:MAG: type II toxin-antitoxin system RelB/DinJ family antitoxin [Coriobacteriales bacterium]|nr:type II toxin-antitoxin system RelB/DinJ family antitoxin [Coriobacteriales bacterium]